MLLSDLNGRRNTVTGRRLDNLDPNTIRVLVFGLQNELAMYKAAAEAANLARNPLVQAYVPDFVAATTKDLDRLVTPPPAQSIYSCSPPPC